jgi:DNA polymerase-3 subunit beta
MKFAIPNSALYPAAKQAAGVALDKSPQHVLQCLLLKTEGDGNVTLVGHDLDRSLVVAVGAEVTEPGAACVNAKRLVALLRAIDDGAVMKVSADDKVLSLQTGRSRFKFDIIDPDDFPPALTFRPAIDGAEPVAPAEMTLDDDIRRRLFEQPEIAISSEETRHYLNGIFICADGDQVTAVATDGHRLIRSVAKAAVTGSWPAIIVRKEAVETMTALKGDSIATDGRIIQMTAERITFASKLVDGTFPDWHRVIPAKSLNTVEFNRAEMLGTLARFKAMLGDVKDNCAKVEWTYGGDALQLQLSRSVIAEDAVSATTGSKDGVVSLNSKYFAEVLEALDAERILFDSADPGSPIRISAPDNDDVIAIIMPMRW